MVPIILCILSGILVVLSLCPHDHWWLAWIALVPFLLALNGTSMRSAARLGLLTGTVINYGAFHWLTVLMNDFSNLGPGAYLVMALMALYQGVPYMLWAVFLRSTLRGRGKAHLIVAGFMSCLFFPVVEFFYPIVFPWYLANTQHTRPDVMGVVELAGAGLLSLCIVAVNLVVARLLLPMEPEEVGNRLWPLPLTSLGRVALALIGMATFAFCWGFSTLRNHQLKTLEESAPKLRLGLVQPNQWIEGDDAVTALHDYQKMTYRMIQEEESGGHPLDLVVWPESAVRTPAPRFLSRRGPSEDGEMVRFPLDLISVNQGLTVPAEELAQERVPAWELLSVQRGHKVPILFGATLQDMSPEAVGALPGGPALYNCAVLLDKEGGVVGVAPKVKLLLFGETIPFAGVFPLVYRLLPMASALVPGKEAVVIDFEQARLGMMICYEDLLPWFHFALAQKHPQLLLNLTNDAWFGKTAEAESHLSLAKLRSVEGRVYLVRSTPTGVSAVVDSTGDVVARMDQDKADTLVYSVPLLDIETGFERWGDSVVWGGLFLCLLYLGMGWFGRTKPD